MEKVMEATSTLKNNKVPGIDIILAELLKTGDNKILDTLRTWVQICGEKRCQKTGTNWLSTWNTKGGQTSIE